MGTAARFGSTLPSWQNTWAGSRSRAN